MDTSKMNSGVTNINNLGFSSIWSGTAYEAQSEYLTETMIKLNKCINDINDFNDILDLRDQYVEICDQISRLYVAIRSCSVDHDDPESRCSCGANYAKIAKLERQRLVLRNKIIGLLGKFVGVDAELYPAIDLSIESTDFKYLFDVDALLEIYSTPGALKPTPDNYGLFDMYNEYDENGNLIPYSGEKYVNDQIAWVVSQCRNEREIAVNVSLLFAKLAADKGYSLTYENDGAQGGLNWGKVNWDQSTGNYTYKDGSGFDPSIGYNQGYNNVTQMEEGMDCCAWVSYALNVAIADDPTAPNPTGFAWQGVGGLNKFGEPVSSSETQPGDIFIAPSQGTPYGHTGMIVSIEEDPNNPGTGTVVIAESGGIKSAYSINQYSYTTDENGKISMLRDGTVFRNMDSVYNGEEVSTHD